MMKLNQWMKSIQTLLGLLVFFGTQGALAANPGERSVRESSRLLGLLVHMEGEATEGANLEYFGWKEAIEPDSSFESHCQTVSANQVQVNFVEIFREVLATEAAPDHQTLADLADVLGEGDYWMCVQSKTEDMSRSVVTSYHAKDGHFRIQFELAYED